MTIPDIEYAVIGGSSTFSVNFPEIVEDKDIEVLESGVVFDTPFGKSPEMKIFSLKGKKVITCKMHGWRKGVSRADASKQIFWVFKEAGIKTILAEGGVGSINTSFAPRDLVVPDDYIDTSARRSVSLTDDYLLVMRDPFCKHLRNALSDSIKNNFSDRKLFTEGVYCNTDGRHFESRAEVKMMGQWGADMIGQSITPEVYLAREIEACYAGVYMVVNYAEGVIKDWEYEELKDIFFNESKNISLILIEALKLMFETEKTCQCRQLRRKTLLK